MSVFDLPVKHNASLEMIDKKRGVWELRCQDCERVVMFMGGPDGFCKVIHQGDFFANHTTFASPLGLDLGMDVSVTNNE